MVAAGEGVRAGDVDRLVDLDRDLPRALDEAETSLAAERVEAAFAAAVDEMATPVSGLVAAAALDSLTGSAASGVLGVFCNDPLAGDAAAS